MEMIKYRRHPSILFGEISGDVVALSVERGLCFGMENVSATVWKLLDRPRTTSEVTAILYNEYEVAPERCRAETAALLEEMERKGLIEAEPADQTGKLVAMKAALAKVGSKWLR